MSAKSRSVYYGPVHLIKGKILGLIDGERMRFEVRAGRWQNQVTHVVREVAVVTQFRKREGCVDSAAFTVVLEPDEVPGIIEGLRHWQEQFDGGLVGACFADASMGRTPGD